MNFDIESTKVLVVEELERLVNNLEKSYPSFKEPAFYTILSNGKRLRPLITTALFSDLNSHSSESEISSIIKPAIAIELLHTASLIHDDLPALDDDDYRRGRLACHRQFSESTAILTGDFLPILGFNLLTASNFNNNVKVKLTEFFSVAFMDLCQGQAFDMVPEEAGKQDLEKISALKTGALFKLSVRFGAINQLVDEKVALTEKYKQTIDRLGDLIGIIFQLNDDLDDGDFGGGKTKEDLLADREVYRSEVYQVLNADFLKSGTALKATLQYAKIL